MKKSEVVVIKQALTRLSNEVKVTRLVAERRYCQTVNTRVRRGRACADVGKMSEETVTSTNEVPAYASGMGYEKQKRVAALKYRKRYRYRRVKWTTRKRSKGYEMYYRNLIGETFLAVPDLAGTESFRG